MAMNDASKPAIVLPSQPLHIEEGTRVEVHGGMLPLTRDKRVIWLLNELGISYDLVEYDVINHKHVTDDYLRLHPSALIPIMRVGDFHMMESVAMVMILADRFPEYGLAPPLDHVERPAYTQWLFYGASSLEIPISRIFNAAPNGPRPDPQELQEQLEIFDRLIITVEKALEVRDYLLPTGFSAADISVAWNLTVADYVGLLDQYPILQRYYDRLGERPAFQVTFAAPEP